MSIFYLPDLGEGLAEAVIRTWHVKEGDQISLDQPLVSVETAKAIVEVPSPQAGRITKLHGRVGETIQTHAPLVEFAGEDKGTVVGELEVGQTLWDESESAKTVSFKESEKPVKAMPAVRALAAKLHVDLSRVTPTGMQGQVTEEDVRGFSDQGGETLQGVRLAMALSMEKSHREVVPVTIFDEADVSAWTDKQDVTVRLIQAIVQGVRAVPLLNAWFDGQTRKMHMHKEIHLGLAMDTAEGLFVPVLRNVEKKSAEELRDAINQFKKSVQNRTIALADMQGATFTLSNVGMIAGKYSTPIILPPMVAILASGKISATEKSLYGMLPLSLTFDHRVGTGAEGSRFLKTLMEVLSVSS